ncbi:MAG: nitrogen regulation protein NR(I) [Lautropia sp.]
MNRIGDDPVADERSGEVWIVDDDQSIRWVLERALSREGFVARTFENAASVLDALAQAEPRTPDVLVSDVRMPGDSGIELLYRLRKLRPALPVIIMTAHSDLDSAVSAFQGGAFEYLPKPFDLLQATQLIRRALAERAHEPLPEEGAAPVQDMLGQAPAMQEVFRAIGRLSQSNVTVLVTGESGTGKELIARALHRHSARASKPFVALNMAAIARDLLESELFGHERGSFTGAQQQRRGRFEQADGGTLFLDEIGDMPAEMQTRLLRVLSEGHFYRVGGHQPIKSNVRVIAATHQHLEERVEQGLFREDLFHRLNVIRLRLPPLRERIEDIGLLARHFLARSAADLGVEAKRLSQPAIDQLARFGWPGNVRQLENVCNWLTVMAPTQTISVADLPPEVRGASQPARAGGLPATERRPAAPGAAYPGDAAGARPASQDREPGAADDAAPAASSGAAAWATGTAAAGRAAPPDRAGQQPDPAGGQPAGVGRAGGHVQGYAAGSGGQAAGAFEVTAALARMHGSPQPAVDDWLALLSKEAARQLVLTHAQPLPPAGEGVMDRLTRAFEATMIRAALAHTRGRRVEAAQRLGIGRNTITRKIQELGLDDAEPPDQG